MKVPYFSRNQGTKLTSAKNELQEEIRYKIGLLNRQRNLIVHEGYSYSPDMIYFTDAIWELSWWVGKRVAHRVCDNLGNYTTIDDVISTYDTPW